MSKLPLSSRIWDRLEDADEKGMPGANILIGVLTVWHYDALQMERTIKEQADKIKELEKRKVCRPSLLRWTRAPAPHWRSHYVIVTSCAAGLAPIRSDNPTPAPGT